MGIQFINNKMYRNNKQLYKCLYLNALFEEMLILSILTLFFGQYYQGHLKFQRMKERYHIQRTNIFSHLLVLVFQPVFSPFFVVVFAMMAIHRPSPHYDIWNAIILYWWVSILGILPVNFPIICLYI